MGYIEDFYRGENVPIESMGFSKEPEYKSLLADVFKKEDILLDSMTPEQQKQFQEIKSIREDINSLESARLFVYAFRSACLLMMDIFSDK